MLRYMEQARVPGGRLLRPNPMQTFLPYPDFRESARTLDRLRLGKQRVEAWQVLRVLLGHSKGWLNHPAVIMWRGYEVALARYGIVFCEEWISRGYKDSLQPKFQMIIDSRTELSSDNPLWLGSDSFHASHRSNLLRKDPQHYGSFGWTEPNDLPYVWPEAAGESSDR